MVAAEGRVELGELAAGHFVVAADDDAVGTGAVVDGAAFLEKLGVGNHAHLQVFLAQLDQGLVRHVQYAGGGADRYGGLDHQGAVGLHVAHDLPRHAEHMAQIGRAVVIRRRAHRDEDQLPMGHRIAGLGAERQSPFAQVVVDQGGESRFLDRWHGFLQLLDLFLVDIDAQDSMTDVGQGGGLDKTDITGPEYADIHEAILRKTWRERLQI
ncbi:hypothetical protein D9M71_524460 [compost metagenome]